MKMACRLSVPSFIVVVVIAALAPTARAQQFNLSGINWPAVQKAAAANREASDKDQTAPQEPVSTRPQAINPSRQFVQRLLADQKAIWLAPSKLRRSDAAWLVPLTTAVALTIATDSRVQSKLTHSDRLVTTSHHISRLGSVYSTFGAAGAIYLIGRLAKNDRAAETGALGIEALINSSIVAAGLKLATRRERPGGPDNDGRFESGGKSFPSGHAATIWALSTVVAEQYHDKPIIRIAAYGVAAAVSISRVTGRNHFPSDALVGSTIGYLIGRYTVRRHSKLNSGRPSPVIAPYYNPAGRSYGVRAVFSF